MVSLKSTPVIPVSGGSGKGGCAGIIVGIGIGGSMCFVGLILTALGITAIVGIPMMVLGGLIALLSPIIGIGAGTLKIYVQGACPHCGEQIKVLSTIHAFDCPICNKRVKNDRKCFIPV